MAGETPPVDITISTAAFVTLYTELLKIKLNEVATKDETDTFEEPTAEWGNFTAGCIHSFQTRFLTTV